VEQLGRHWAHFVEILYLRIFRKSVGKLEVSLTGTLHEEGCAFVVGSVSASSSQNEKCCTPNVAHQSCTENQNTHFVFGNFFFNRAVNQILWKDMVERGRPQMAIWRMRFAWWTPKATNTP
jgi:hypothetical protein